MVRRALAAAAVTAVLAGCTSEATTEQNPLPPPPGARADVTLSSATPEPAGPQLVALGEPITIPCSSIDPRSCMTVTFTDVRADVPCALYSGLDNDQAIAVDIETSMPLDADPAFTSPFRSSPWSAFSSTSQVTRVQTEFCGGDSSKLDLMAEFPGGNAKATVYLDSPADTEAVVFQPNHGELYVIDVAP